MLGLWRDVGRFLGSGATTAVARERTLHLFLQPLLGGELGGGVFTTGEDKSDVFDGSNACHVLP